MIHGGGEDAKVSNTVDLCEDDIEDGGRVFTTASASRSLPEEEAKIGFSFEIESIDDDEGGNRYAEGNEEKMAEEEEVDDEVEEDGEEEDYEMASRCLKSPHLSSFFLQAMQIKRLDPPPPPHQHSFIALLKCGFL